MKKRILSVLLVLALVCALLPQTALPDAQAAGAAVVYDAADIPAFQRTRQQVASRYFDALDVGPGCVDGSLNTYYVRPASTSAPYDQGVLKQDTLDAMIAMTNYLRWLTGANPLQKGCVNNDALQRGALIRNFDFAHTVSDSNKPDDMDQALWDSGKVGHNIIAIGYTPRGSIIGWCNEGYSRRSGSWGTVGHRYCLIGTDVSALRLGYAGSVAIGALDGFQNAAANPFTAFPGPGPNPTEVIDAWYSAWSVQPDTSRFRVPDANALRVTVTDLTAGSSYVCSMADGTLRYNTWDWEIDFVQPETDGWEYPVDSRYRVSVTGLEEIATGKAAELRYEVEFFSTAPYVKPVITQQPKDVTVKVGAAVTLTTVADGSNLSYQWQKSTDGGKTWANCTSSGAKTAAFSFTASAGLNGWMYRCKVSNAGGSVTSSAAKLTVTIPAKPVITTQPKAVTVAAGATGKFTVAASGSNLSYQWQKSTDGGKTWANCSSSGAKTAAFSFTASASYNGWMYRCMISNKAGSVTSSAAKLTVTIPAKPVITTQPKPVTVAAGSTGKFTVTATGSNLSYQWQKSTDGGKTWANCSSSGAKTAAFSFMASASYNGWMYRCKVSNAGGSVTSSAAKLTVTAAKPVITAQPKPVTVAAGSTGKFTVTATGSGLSYQWQKSTDGGKTWANCSSSGAKTAAFSFTASASYNGWMYRCKVTNAGGSVTSSAAKLTVTAAKPVITAQPKSITVKAGTTGKFTVTATGSGLSYQWQKSTDGGKTWANCTSSGAKTAAFSFTASAAYNGWMYRCKVTNAGGTVTSSAARLTVG